MLKKRPLLSGAEDVVQLYALDEEKRHVSARQALKQKNYTCIECQGIVRLRGGIHKQEHFFHLSPERKCKLNGKSMAHLQTQNRFLEMISEADCRLEHTFPEIHRIADVFWISQNIVFEIQCSLISEKEIQERNADYLSIGIQVVWILHLKKYNKHRLTAAEIILKNQPHYFTDINADGKGKFYDQAVWIEGGSRYFLLPLIAVTPCILYENLPGQTPSILLNERSKHWSFFCEEDLTFQFHSSKDYQQKLLAAEKKWIVAKQSESKFTIKKIGLFLISYIIHFYKIFFKIVLEKSCR